MIIFRTEAEQEAIERLDEASKPVLEVISKVRIVSEKDKARLDKIWQEVKLARKRATRPKKDADNEALSLVCCVRSAMNFARLNCPDCSPMAAINVLLDAPFPGSLDAGTLIWFNSRCTEAILKGDDAFFAALAGTLRGDIKPTEVDKLIGYLQNAYFVFQQAETLFPTKKQVRDLALRQNVIENLFRRPANRRWDLNEVFSPADNKNIESAIEILFDKQSSWPRLWKAAGLNSLDSDSGGAGLHRIRRNPSKRRGSGGKG